MEPQQPLTCSEEIYRVRVMVTFNNIKVIAWWEQVTY
jgi:hypothetical protein